MGEYFENGWILLDSEWFFGCIMTKNIRIENLEGMKERIKILEGKNKK